jgi:hypothetical protein
MVIKPEQTYAAVVASQAFAKTHKVGFTKNGEAVLIEKPGSKLVESESIAAKQERKREEARKL